MNNTLLLPDNHTARLLPIGWLLAAFLLVRFPTASECHRYYQDEHFYTDGALEMIERGDYLTPRTSEGRPRFNKPPLTYWVVTAAFHVFGPSFLASRIFFLFAGAAVLLLTWHLARMLLEDERAAILAPAILLTNMPFLHVSQVCITDILLTLGILLSLFSFAALMFRQGSTWPWAWLAYGGAGVAMLAKGLPGLLPIGFAWSFGAIACRKDAGCRFPFRLSHLPALIFGLALALGWMYALWQRHGDAFWHGFWEDQIGSRLERSKWLSGLFYYPVHLLALNFPWILPLALLFTRHRAQITGDLARRRGVYLFLLGWCAFLMVFYIPGNIQRTRYLIPAFPLFAVFLAGFLSAAGRRVRVERLWRLAVWIGAVLCLVVGATMAWTHAQFTPRFLWGGLLFVAFGIACARWLRARRPGAGLVFALLFVASVSLGDFTLFSYLEHNPAQEAARVIQDAGADHGEIVVAWNVSRHLPSQIAVALGGRVRLLDWTRKYEIHPPPRMLFKEAKPPDVDLSEYRRIVLGNNYADVEEIEALRAFLRGEHRAYMQKRERRYILAIRQEP